MTPLRLRKEALTSLSLKVCGREKGRREEVKDRKDEEERRKERRKATGRSIIFEHGL
jgi:hypothetical protein